MEKIVLCFGLVLCLYSGLLAPGAQAQPAAAQPPSPSARLPPGTGFQGSIRVRDRTIPLPPGQWIELGRSAWVGGERSAEFSYEKVGLGRVSAGRVDALTVITTANYDGGISVRSWGPSPVCNRTDTLSVVVNSADERNQSCMLLNHVIGGNSAQGSPFWLAYNQLREGQPQQAFPTTMISAAYRLSGGTRSTTVTYLFGVERHGFPVTRTSWDASPWHRARVSGERSALVDRYKAWMTANFDSVRRGIENAQAVALSAPP